MPTDATRALYYLKGIETALLSPQQAQAWADAVIAGADEPHHAFIDIALSKGTAELISALGTVPGEGDAGEAGAWLLAGLQQADVQTVDGLASAVRKAMVVCRHCGLGDDVYYEFDGIDDSLYLAGDEASDSVQACRADFLAGLERHARPYPAISGMP